MPVRNIYHDAVVKALESDGWQITDDPLVLAYGGRDWFVDLGAEGPTIGAVKDGVLIAVEIQSFIGHSAVHDLEQAVGQYSIYRTILAVEDPNRRLYIAVPERIFNGILSEQFGQLILSQLDLRVMVFNQKQERIVRWIN